MMVATLTLEIAATEFVDAAATRFAYRWLGPATVTGLAAAVALRFAARGEGAIVNISSILALMPEFTPGIYGANHQRNLLSDQPIRPLRRFHVAGGKDIAMRTHNGSCHTLDRMQPAFADIDPRTSEQRSTRSPNSSTRSEQHRSFVPGKRMPPTLRNEMAKLLADIIDSLVSSKLEKMGDRMRGSSLRRDEPLSTVELGSIGDSLAWLLALLNEIVLRVGPLELDLIDRSAKRGDRHIHLRPREFQLLKYMMQRSDKLLTRAALLKEVWHYKFVPKTNLVDVQIGLLRRKVDGTNEARMIRTVRGVGFVLDTTPLPQGSPTTPATRSMPAPIGNVWPRPRNLSTNSQATQPEQEQLSPFDEKQQKPNEILDERFTICRC
jgi:DNA-binding winged helix-turn-helix (wHTH) protein